VIEAGYGGPPQVEVMQAIAAAVTRPVVLGLTRVVRKDVERVLRGVERARRPGVNVYVPASDRFLAAARTTRERAVEAVCDAVGYACQHVDHVEVSAQDAARADPAYLVTLFAAVIDAGATVACVADTTSHALPDEFGALCTMLRDRVRGGDRVTWSVHCHNTLGLAVANALAAIAGGVRQVECTVDGIGEGAGNTPLEPVAHALRTRADVYAAVTTGIVPEQLEPTSRLLAASVDR
jgi:2-isopropylmalate synthase